MSKVLFIGDPHLKISRFETVMTFLDWVEETIKNLQPDLVVNLGDTFDTHAVLRSEILTEFSKHALKVVQWCPYFYVLGNHDMWKPKDATYHALQTLDVPEFTVIDTPMSWDEITYVPYCPNKENFPTKTEKICVAHQTFIGADFGGFRPEEGVEPETVSAEIIISGHVHTRQMFGKVIYPGTPYPQGIHDINQSKGLMLFDTDTYEYEFIESPLPKWRGLKFDVADTSIDEIHRALITTVNDKDQWIIEVAGPKTELVGYLNSKQYLALKEGKNLRMKYEYTDKVKREQTRIKSFTMNDIVDEYVDKIYSGSFDKSIIKNTAFEILNGIK